MEIELSVYPHSNRRRKKNLKSEVVILRAEIAQLQHRHNQLVKAVLALAKGHNIFTSVAKSRLDVTTRSEADFISRYFEVDPDDDLLTSDEEEIEDLLRG